MKYFKQILYFILLTAIAATTLTGCVSTSNEHGVQVKKKQNLNPLNYISFPFL